MSVCARLKPAVMSNTARAAATICIVRMNLGPLRQAVRGLDQGPDVAVTECKGLQAMWVVWGDWHVVRHQHIRIPDLSVNLDRLHEIDVRSEEHTSELQS